MESVRPWGKIFTMKEKLSRLTFKTEREGCVFPPVLLSYRHMPWRLKPISRVALYSSCKAKRMEAACKHAPNHEEILIAADYSVWNSIPVSLHRC